VEIKTASDSNAVIEGNTNILFENGWARFSDLAISREGEYTLTFKVLSPESYTGFILDSTTIQIEKRNLQAQAEVKTVERISGSPIELDISIEDTDSVSTVSDISWADHTWSATLSLLDSSYYVGTLDGTLTVDFDASTGVASFVDVSMSLPGKVTVLVTVTSSPADYTLQKELELDSLSAAQRDIVVEVQNQIELKFDVAYDATKAQHLALQILNHYSLMDEWRVLGFTHRAGSTYITLTVEGSTLGVANSINGLCGQIENSTTFVFDGINVSPEPYLTVDGSAFYGVQCGPITTTAAPTTTPEPTTPEPTTPEPTTPEPTTPEPTTPEPTTEPITSPTTPGNTEIVPLSNDKEVPVALIAGAVVGGFVILGVVVILILYINYHTKWAVAGGSAPTTVDTAATSHP